MQLVPLRNETIEKLSHRLLREVYSITKDVVYNNLSI